MASVFAMRLEAAGHAGAATLLPITFITIIATVAVYGLTAPIVARRFGVSESNPQGILFAGAAPWVREVALRLQREGFSVLLVDSDRGHTSAARMAGLTTHTGSILSEHTLDELELGGIGRLPAVTPNDWVNMLTVHRFDRVFGRANCYQLPPQAHVAKKKGHGHVHGRWLFAEDIGHEGLARRVLGGFTIKATGLTEAFTYDALLARYGDTALPLFLIHKNRKLDIIGPESDAKPEEGDTIIALVRKDA